MDKEKARKIIKETFENPFNKEKFIYFIKNFLNKVDESKSFLTHGYVKEMFRAVIKTYEHIGTYNSPEGKKIDILIVYLQKDYSLDHARPAQRNFARSYLIGRGEKDAGLFAFVAPNIRDWRFSLIKMDYKWEESATGKTKVKEEFTPARRWSFLVGVNEKSHTAQSRLIDILANDEQSLTLENIEKAFDIETVTKEFFLKYRELFLCTKEGLDKAIANNPKIKDDFEKKGVDTVNFAKKLLGQIIFLYFLQKKGWFGVGRNDDWGTGSKSFLRELFDKKHVNYNNFFNDVLEHLFYDALRTDRDNDYFDLFNCRIPFLNGGLFDPIGNYDWEDADILLSNELFSNGNKTKEGDDGDGIIDIFDRYNFTVKEDEPLEKEVAIDPELLGKAYEKFNAIRPDNYDEFKKVTGKGGENKFNKAFGVYYTPREIVHYMCQQSLISYLSTELGSKVNKEYIETLVLFGEHISENESTALKKEQSIIEGKQQTSSYKTLLHESIRKNALQIDKALADITICDPAVGSGAFPVGMMSEIVRTRRTLFNSGFLSNDGKTPYEFKRQCIEHSLYGVDIDPGAVEIAKLRLWLSLVVDEDDFKNIKPLPNLDYRIMQGDTLISGTDFNNENKLFKDEAGDAIEYLWEKKDKFVRESDALKKTKLKEEIDNLLIEIYKIKSKNKESNYFKEFKGIEDKYSRLPNKEQRDKSIKRDKEKLCKKLNFDPESAERQLKEYTGEKRIKHFFMWKLNFSEIFYDKTGSERSQRGGFDVVIANPPYIQLQKMADNVHHYADLYENEEYKTFERTGDIYALFYEKGINLLKNKGSLCYITSNKWMRAKYGTSLRRFFSKKNPLKLIDLGPGVFKTATVDTNILLIKNSESDKANLQAFTVTDKAKMDRPAGDDFNNLMDLSEDSWIILSPAEQNIKRKIEHIGTPLKEWDINIYYGIKTGLNEAFIIDCKTKDKLISKDPKSADIIKPILRGKDITRYEAKFADLWLIATFPVLNLNINNYPAVKVYLEQFLPRIKPAGETYIDKNRQKQKTRKKTCNSWFETQDPIAYYQEFEKEKIVYQEIVRDSQFYYDTKKYYPEATTFILTGQNIKYLIALLNSSPVTFFYKRFYAGGGLGERGFRYKKVFIQKIPIPQISESDQRPFKELADIIIAKKEKGIVPPPEEQEIDRLVYKLYNLTEEEIRIIEKDNDN